MTEEFTIEEDGQDPTLQFIDIDDIHTGDNIRTSELEVDDLKESIKSVGLLSPIVVKAEEAVYHVIAGHRRVQALRDLQFEDEDAFVDRFEDGIPCLVLPGEFESGDTAIIGLQLTENSVRKDLSISETANAVIRMKAEGRSDDDIAKCLGRRKDAVQRLAQIGESLVSSANSLADSGVLSISAALKLSELPAADQEAVVENLYGVWFGEGKVAATEAATESLVDNTDDAPAEDLTEDEDGETQEGPALTPRYLGGRLEDLRNTLMDEYESGAATIAMIDDPDGFDDAFSQNPDLAAGFLVAMEVVAGVRGCPSMFRPELGM